MALTDEEKRLLAQLEASLAAEDPQLAHRLRGVGQRRLPVRRLAVAAVGLIAGVALLIVGIQTHPLVSVLGFLVMLAACVVAVGAWRTDNPDRPVSARRTGSRRTKRRPTNSADGEFMDRMEERWRKRQNGGQ